MKYIVEKTKNVTFWRNEKGEYHREDGPAIEWATGDKYWYLNDELHRVDGPAIERANGDKEWWLNGQRLYVNGEKMLVSKEDLDHIGFFKDVVFIVEADSFSRHMLWRENFGINGQNAKVVKSWEEISEGFLVTVGHFANCQVCVEIFFSIINGKKVMFYDAVSEVVKHSMVKDWLLRYSEGITWDNGERWAHCDALNFAQCIEAISQAHD
jgi:hypothetical protein